MGTLGILINTYNDSGLLKRALRDLFANYTGGYTLFLDDDGSSDDEYRRISEIAAKYSAHLTRSCIKKGRSNAYLIVRQMELFYTLASKHNVDRVLKMDPDTTIYSSSAFNGCFDADLVGFRKIIDYDDLEHRNIRDVFSRIGNRFPLMNSYFVIYKYYAEKFFCIIFNITQNKKI